MSRRLNLESIASGQPVYGRIDVSTPQGGDHVGDTVCISGWNVGFSCGTEQSTNYTTYRESYPDSGGNQYTLQYQRLASLQGSNGDSGAAWFNPTSREAVGQNVGATSDSQHGVFSSIYDITHDLGVASGKSLSVVTTSYAQTVEHDNPALWYRLNDSGQVDALSPLQQHTVTAANSGWGGHALDGRVVGDVTFGEPGAQINDPSTAAFFDGLTGAVVVPAPGPFAPSVPAFTAEAWYATESSAQQYIIALTGQPPSGSTATVIVGLGLTGGVPFADVTDTAGTSHHLSAGAQYTGPNYHYMAITDDGSTLTLYVDGNSVATTAVSGTIPYNGNQAGFIGSDGEGHLFSGSIGDAAAYTYALSNARIQLHYSGGHCAAC